MNMQYNTIKRSAFALMTVICLLISFVSIGHVERAPLSVAYADTWEDPDKEIEDNLEKKEEFLNGLKSVGYEGNLEEFLEKIEDDYSSVNKNDSIKWAMRYLFTPGHYIEDVNNSSSLAIDDRGMSHRVNGRLSVCYHDDEPQNLLNHNCDIPTLGTELFQHTLRDLSKSGVTGAERTSSVASWGLGLPAGIPNGKVPVDPNERSLKYTALELFGYDLRYTNYYGEWDDIQVSTEARLLSNVGWGDRFRLAGATIWNGVSNMLKDFWNSWTFSVTKWKKDPPGFLDGAVTTVVDTSDLYTAASHEWKRPFFSKTAYNLYYLSDSQVMDKAEADFLAYFKQELFKRADTHPRIKEVFYLMPDEELNSNWPVYSYQSEKWCIDPHFDENGNATCGGYSTEKETWEKWKSGEVRVAYDLRGKAQGIDCFSTSADYDELKTCWSELWIKYAEKEANHDLPVMQQIITSIKQDFFEDNPHYDPNRGIAHYICADEEGNPLGDGLEDYRYVYRRENSRGPDAGEHLTSGCNPIRPTIQGGMYGTGTDNSTDTRYHIYEMTKDSPIDDMNFWGKLGRWVASFSTKMTNTLISLSFINLSETFGLGDALEELMVMAREGIFLPLSTIIIAFTALFLMTKAATSPGEVFKSIGTVVLIFVVGTLLLLIPGPISDSIETVPLIIDNFIANIVLDEAVADTGICSSSGDASSIRSIQCLIWESTVFRPYIQGQWGTSYENLNVSSFNNTNESLVGDAAVNMGGGHIENNWGLWQLSKIKNGTITTPGETGVEGTTSKSIYKVVDLQAGPNNGAQSDPKYLYQWSGVDSSARNTPQVYSGIISMFLLVIIGGFALLKLETTFQLFLLFLMLPLEILVSLAPNKQMHFKEFFSELFGLVLRRAFISLLLLVTLRIISSVLSQQNLSYNLSAIFVVAFLIMVKVYWKELASKVATTSRELSAPGTLIENAKPTNWLPASLRMGYVQRKEMMKQGLAGALGGAVAGVGSAIAEKQQGIERADGVSTIIESIRSGAQRGQRRGASMEMRKQRRMGFGILHTLSLAENAGRQSVMKRELTEGTIEEEKINVVQEQIRTHIIEVGHAIDEVIKRGESPEIVSLKEEKERYLYAYNKLNSLASEGKHFNAQEYAKTASNRDFMNLVRNVSREELYDKDEHVRHHVIDDFVDKAYEGRNIMDNATEVERNETRKEIQAEIHGIKEDFKEINEIVKDNIAEVIKKADAKVAEKIKSLTPEEVYYRNLETLIDNDVILSNGRRIKEYLGDMTIINSHALHSEVGKLEEKAKFGLDTLLDDVADHARMTFEQLESDTVETGKGSIFEKSKDEVTYKSADPYARAKFIERQLEKENILDELGLKRPEELLTEDEWSGGEEFEDTADEYEERMRAEDDDEMENLWREWNNEE